MLRPAVLLCLCLHLMAAEIVVGFDGEFGHRTSTSAQAVAIGAQLAIDEINAAGGVLGRPLRLERRDHRGVPSRGVDDLRELAAIPDLVAVLQGKFSPVAQAQIPVAQELGVPLMLTWSSAEGLVDNGQDPNWVFRVSTRDTAVFTAMVERATAAGHRKLGLLAPSNTWGRSGLASAERAAIRCGVDLISEWYPFGASSLAEPYERLRTHGATALLLQANEGEAAVLVREMAAMPAERRLPVIAHWGLTGGTFHQLCGAALASVDLAVVQTFSFADAQNERGRHLLARLAGQHGWRDPAAIPAPVGVAHAYDAVHLVALATAQAGSTQRAAVRTALERLPPHDGAVRRYDPAFTPSRHEAFDGLPLFFCRLDADGRLIRAGDR